MNRLLLQSLFVLLFTGMFGSNALARMSGEAPLPGQLCSIEQVLEAETEPADESCGPEDLSGSGFGPGGDHLPSGCQPFFGSAFAEFHSCFAGCIGQSASIRQSQVNLLNSFHAPAMFILFHSYQGYLS
ncbi:MAG TPA: hypothetical protein DCF33_12660 [Saprospirales bacterium]|nr:hypothetical protein [Saprospirales bacterium]